MTAESIIKPPPQTAGIHPEDQSRAREIYRVKGGGVEGGLGAGPQGRWGLPDEEKGGVLLVQGIIEEAGGKFRGQKKVAPGSQLVADLDFFAGGVIIQENVGGGFGDNGF
jgi:hypothetical protein